MWSWVDEFASAIETKTDDLDIRDFREQSAAKIQEILTKAAASEKPTKEEDEVMHRLLDACRVFMRDRRHIDALLSTKMLDTFLVLALEQSWSYRVREKALTCMINSVYSRPEFILETLIGKKVIARIMELAMHEGTVTFHWLLWKFVLLSCEAPEVPHYLKSSLEFWQLIYATLFYGFKRGNQADVVAGDRVALLLELIKLIAVVVNEMEWNAELDQPLQNIVHKLGALLLDILRFEHPTISPLDDNLVDIKCKAIEVFMLLPGNLLVAFLHQQHHLAEKPHLLLSPVIKHLHSMLLKVKVEKTRPLNEILPALIVCYNLAKVGDPEILAEFKMEIMPESQLDVDSNQQQLATKTFFFNQLKTFLTSLDSDVRRYTSEWFFLLCNENASNKILTPSWCRPLTISANEYTQCFGLGNAIGLLRMKDLQ